MEACADFEKAYSPFYIAFRGTATKPGGGNKEAGLSAGIILLCSISGHRFLSDVGPGQADFRVLADAARHLCAGLCNLSGGFGCDVGVALPFHPERLALAAVFDSARYSAKN